jgi:hypothetical protein
VRWVHYYDEGVHSVTKAAEDIQKKKSEELYAQELLAKAKGNVSVSANDIKLPEVAAPAAAEQEAPPKMSFEEERHRLIALGTGPQLHMTFIDFVLAMWNFLSADEEMLMKVLWELVEIGKYHNNEGTNAVSPKACEDIIRMFQPTQVFETSKRCQNMFNALKDTALIQDHKDGKTVKNPTGKETLIFLGNFVQLCVKTRSFSSIVTRLQLDIQGVLMGNNFWKRHMKSRREKYGSSNLHFVLQGDKQGEECFYAMSQEDMVNKIKIEEPEPEPEEEAAEEVVEDAIFEKKETRRIGQTILLIDMKRSKGEKLTSEESWLLQKATVQAKAANMMYMRQSKAVMSSNKKEWYGPEGMKRGKNEDEETLHEGDEDESESDESC